jgi:hypothetical protein
MDDGSTPAFGSATVTNAANDFALVLRGTPIAPNSYTITTIGGGVFRVSATGTTGAGNNQNGVIRYSTNSGRPFRFIGYQLELGSTPTAYQRVTTAFDVTESGQRDCYGVRADGTDDGYATAGNVDFSNSPRMTVWAALRKRSDAAQGVFLELSSNWSTNDGAFSLQAPVSAAANFASTSRGSSVAIGGHTATAPGFAAPSVAILTAEFDIANDINRLFVNGVLAASATADQGAGNFRNDILYLFRRGGTSAPFNGDKFGLIVAGDLYQSSVRLRIDRLLSRITPTVNL